MGFQPMAAVLGSMKRSFIQQSRQRSHLHVVSLARLFFRCAKCPRTCTMGKMPMPQLNQIHLFRLNRYSIPLTANAMKISAPRNTR
jgi:hypothetical protein